MVLLLGSEVHGFLVFPSWPWENAGLRLHEEGSKQFVSGMGLCLKTCVRVSSTLLEAISHSRKECLKHIIAPPMGASFPSEYPPCFLPPPPPPPILPAPGATQKRDRQGPHSAPRVVSEGRTGAMLRYNSWSDLTILFFFFSWLQVSEVHGFSSDPSPC